MEFPIFALLWPKKMKEREKSFFSKINILLIIIQSQFSLSPSLVCPHSKIGEKGPSLTSNVSDVCNSRRSLFARKA